MHSIIDSPIN